MLELGLQRISRLVDAARLPWRAIHVAGTNGKGSTCTAINTVLNAARIPTGMFTSPHLIDRWDGIVIKGQTIQEDSFLDIEKQVKDRDERLKIGATEFELLTATAFEAFNRAKIEIGIVEVGVGGAFDATNILRNPIATLITKIARDHEALLGTGLVNIAKQKAGIMKPGAPCFVHGENSTAVKDVLVEKAAEAGVSLFKVLDPLSLVDLDLIWSRVADVQELETWQRGNLVLAYEASRIAFQEVGRPADEVSKLFHLALHAKLPGRLQRLDLSRVNGRGRTAILDGAHNGESITALRTYINHNFRKDKPPAEGGVTWVLGFTDGKKVEDTLPDFLEHHDDVIAVEFGPVAGMPWINPFPAPKILEVASEARELKTKHIAENMEQALTLALSATPGNPIVIAGSLYLVADVLRLLRSKGASDEELGFDHLITECRSECSLSS